MRKVRTKIILGIVTVLVLLGLAYITLNAERRIFSMVTKYQVIYEQAALQLLEDGEIRDIEDIDSIYVFSGEHEMVEFTVDDDWILPSAQYYGFYYSPDDVPLAFQNVDVPLTEYKENEWKWTGEGDNRGITKKITDCWYYFEASF